MACCRSSRSVTQSPQMSEGKAAIQREGGLMSLRLGWVAQLVQTAPLQELIKMVSVLVSRSSLWEAEPLLKTS